MAEWAEYTRGFELKVKTPEMSYEEAVRHIEIRQVWFAQPWYRRIMFWRVPEFVEVPVLWTAKYIYERTYKEMRNNLLDNIFLTRDDYYRKAGKPPSE